MFENRPSVDTPAPLSPGSQCTAFLASLFHRNDLVEVRAIENLDDDTTRLVNRGWRRAFTTSLLFSDFRKLNENRANIYVGVNPRTRRDGTKQSIAQCRCVWVDLDNISYQEAEKRWRGLLPTPSMSVSSGHGVHAYWQLDQPHSVASIEDRQRFEGMLKCLYRELGADSTQDVCRMLRLPGFDNVKGDPVPCELIHSGLPKVTISQFDRWFAEAAKAAMSPATPPMVPLAKLAITSESAIGGKVRQLTTSLDQPNNDRSRRDFAVVCDLLRLGLSVAEIRSLVDGHSKFTSATYTETTLQNAVTAVHESGDISATKQDCSL